MHFGLICTYMTTVHSSNGIQNVKGVDSINFAQWLSKNFCFYKKYLAATFIVT